MSKKLGQEPAFPQEPIIGPNGGVEIGSQYFGEFSSGISKRFYAACAAMQGLASNTSVINTGEINVKLFVQSAFMIADELLKQEAEYNEQQ